MISCKELSTLKKNRDFKRIYSCGKSFVSPGLVTYIIKNRKICVRYGITTSKKIGIAVKRNRARRIIKESFRQFVPYLKGGYDIVFVARKRTPFMKCADVEVAMRKHLNQAGVLK